MSERLMVVIAAGWMIAANAAAQTVSAGTAADEARGPNVAISDIDETVLSSPVRFAWGVDPFERPPGFMKADKAAPSKPENFKLSAIIFDPEEPMAVIDGETVGLGDSVDRFEVKEIGPQYVVLEGAGSRFELSMPAPKRSRKRSAIEPLFNTGAKPGDDK